jgi:hypothetical protein
VLPGAPFHPAASSYDPPTGVFAIWYFWIAPAPGINYKFRGL